MSVADKTVDINSLERGIFDICCEIGRAMFRAVLESYDADLQNNRDRQVYRHKGARKTVLKTKMGEVEYERTVYEVTDEEGHKGFVYLLDEALGLKGHGFFSELLSEEIVRACCASSYRDAAHEVSALTGQTVSHTSAWKVVQDVGERVGQQEQKAAQLAAKGQGEGKLERKLLFEEQDGIWLRLQGKSRKQYGSSREMKLAIAYDGAKKTGTKRYELTNKVACANFEAAQSFVKRKEGVIAQTYNIDEIEQRFLNGDGAPWIRQSVVDDTVHFQLDPFHRNKAIRMWVRNPDQQKEMMRLLYAKEIDILLEYIDALSNSVEDSTEGMAEGENLRKLLAYFTNNKDGLVPCHRRGLEVPKPQEGQMYRRMGAMESNVFSLVGNRMKNRRACWSIKGGDNLARLLCLRTTKRLTSTMQSLTSTVLPVKYAEEITKSYVALSAGKGYDGEHRISTSSLPSSPNHWLKDILSMRPLSDIFT